MARKASGSVRKIHARSCVQFAGCTCGGRGRHIKPCPKATRCRCEGRWQARITAPDGTTVRAPSTFKAKIDAEEWVRTERGLMEDPFTYVTAQTRIEAAKERARRDQANTFGVYAETLPQRTRPASQDHPGVPRDPRPTDPAHLRRTRP